MQMDAGLDTGAMVLVADLEVSPEETSATLHDRLALLGAKLIVDVLRLLQEGKKLMRIKQPTVGITYAEKILKTEAEIDWGLSATQIDARIRAFNPFPGASSNINGEVMKIWNSCIPKADVCAHKGNTGEVLGFGDIGAYIQCGDGVIEILEMQKPGGKKMSAKMCLQSLNTTEGLLRFQTKE